MHAAIVADTLRVPWVPLMTSSDINSFKWLDWTQSMRVPYQPVRIGAQLRAGELAESSIYYQGWLRPERPDRRRRAGRSQSTDQPAELDSGWNQQGHECLLLSFALGLMPESNAGRPPLLGQALDHQGGISVTGRYETPLLSEQRRRVPATRRRNGDQNGPDQELGATSSAGVMKRSRVDRILEPGSLCHV